MCLPFISIAPECSFLHYSLQLDHFLIFFFLHHDTLSLLFKNNLRIRKLWGRKRQATVVYWSSLVLSWNRKDTPHSVSAISLPNTKMWRAGSGKDPDARKDWRQEGKGVTEDEMAGGHHRLNGHEFGLTLGDREGQGSLAWCSPWGHKEWDTTEQLHNNNLGELTPASTITKTLLSLSQCLWCAGNTPDATLPSDKYGSYFHFTDEATGLTK